MAKERKTRPGEDTVYVDESGRKAIVERMRAMTPPMSKAELARQCKVTPAAITLLISTPITDEEGTRGCRFTSLLEKALGIRIPRKQLAVVDPEIRRRVLAIAQKLRDDPQTLANWMNIGDSLGVKR